MFRRRHIGSLEYAAILYTLAIASVHVYFIELTLFPYLGLYKLFIFYTLRLLSMVNSAKSSKQKIFLMYWKSSILFCENQEFNVILNRHIWSLVDTNFIKMYSAQES